MNYTRLIPAFIYVASLSIDSNCELPFEFHTGVVPVVLRDYYHKVLTTTSTMRSYSHHPERHTVDISLSVNVPEPFSPVISFSHLCDSFSSLSNICYSLCHPHMHPPPVLYKAVKFRVWQ